MRSIYKTNSWRKWNKSQWLLHFEKRGLYSKIPSFTGTISKKCLKAGRLFAKNDITNFSGMELTALLYLDTWNENDAPQMFATIYGALSSRYQKYKEELTELGMPAIQLLRIEAGIYQGNLLKCKGYAVHPQNVITKISEPIYDIQVSKNDWMEGASLPIEYDFQTAKLFGYYWGVASLMQSGKNSSQMMLSAKESLRDYLLTSVKPLMERVHTCAINVKDQYGQQARTFKSEKVMLNGIYLHKTSQSLVSFLTHEHRFPKPRKGVTNKKKPRIQKPHLPKIPWTDETIDGFVTGLIALRGNDGCYKSGNSFVDKTVISLDGTFAHELDALLTVRGHSHSKQAYKNNWIIVLNKEPTLYFRNLKEKHL